MPREAGDTRSQGFDIAAGKWFKQKGQSEDSSDTLAENVVP